LNCNDFSLPAAEQHQLLQACEQLMQRFQTLLLATQAEQGAALSYAPYIRSDEGDFYIFISRLAEHTDNLQRHPNCRLMFIADEADSRNLFARERLSWRCQAQRVEPGEALYSQQLDALQRRFGETLKLLRTLPDFCLFRLRPIDGRYVVGFGQAYQLDPLGGTVSRLAPGTS
jgi:putative heme iron utilization protein